MGRLFISVCLAVSATLATAQSRPAKARSGAQLFKVYCAKCHTFGRSYGPAPGLHQVVSARRLTESQVRDVVMAGRNTMPPFERKLNAGELEKLVAYLKTK